MPKEIPLTRPEIPLLDTIDTPADVRRLDPWKLEVLAEELRAFLLWTVGPGGISGPG